MTLSVKTKLMLLAAVAIAGIVALAVTSQIETRRVYTSASYAKDITVPSIFVLNELTTLTELERAKSPELSIPKSPSSPALGVQRRLTPHRVMSDQYTPQRTPTESWPLPSKIESGDGDQPYTADGVANASPPAIAGNEYKLGTPQRHNTASTVRTTGGTPVYSEKTGKKKRFPMLRKVFGLYD